MSRPGSGRDDIVLLDALAGGWLQAAGVEVGVSYVTLSGLERGTHRPSADTARKLARWLGWTMEQVFEASGKPPPAVD